MLSSQLFSACVKNEEEMMGADMNAEDMTSPDVIAAASLRGQQVGGMGLTGLLLAGVLLLSGCRPDAALKDSEAIGKGPPSQPSSRNSAASNAAVVDPLHAGSIVGTVHFKGAAPKPVTIDMSMDPACAMAGENSSEQYVVNEGRLANVYVYIKAGAPQASVTSASRVVMDQKGCRYAPHVIALQQGGTVAFKNSDPTMHNVHIVAPSANGALDVSEGPMSAPQSEVFSTPQVMTQVRCNNHPWMSAFINVAPTPYFAVTEKDGRFSIQGLPPGKYTLAAVHEKLGEQDVEITVADKATEKADFTFEAK
jgi:plastocyanin